MSTTPDVTLLLNRIETGDKNAVNDLFPLIYNELRRRAGRQMAAQRRGHTLQATALVHEAYVRLVGREALSFASREHFYNAAAQAMRQILVDHSRRVKAKKRDGGMKRVEMEAMDGIASPGLPADDDTDWEALDLAMSELQKEDQRRYQVVMYRYFAGIGEEDVAKMLDVSVKTVQRDWKLARIYLLARMTG